MIRLRLLPFTRSREETGKESVILASAVRHSTIPSVPVLLASLCVFSVRARAENVFLPELDLDGVKASYLLALPPDHDPDLAYPVIVDFHGAIHPSQRGGAVTYRRVWAQFVERVPCIVACPNGRTRSWGMPRGAGDNHEYLRAVLADVRERCRIDPGRVYLAGFSSGSDFLCSSNVQVDAGFAGSLVICPGPPNVVGLRRGELLRAKDTPFLFVTGQEDVIRKDGAWQAFLTLDEISRTDPEVHAMYREVPGVGHAFAGLDEYARLFEQLEILAGNRSSDDRRRAEQAFAAGDYLLASSLALGDATPTGLQLQATLREQGIDALESAVATNVRRDPGGAYEAWWHLRTQFHRFGDLATLAQQHLDEDFEWLSGLELLRARRDFYERRRPWEWDSYYPHERIVRRMKALAKWYPERAALHSIGKSIEGRDLWVLELTDSIDGAAADKPAAFVMGGIHGNEASAVVTTLYFAWQLAANPDGKRSIRKLMERFTFYIAPAVNPDALAHFLAEPHSHWRPRFNYRPHDADGDGRVDEDPCEDLDGDGEIGHMYRQSADGPYVLADGRLVRGDGEPRYELIAREGRDNDGDGLYSEDPPGGVNLNRNFPVGFRPRRDFEGFRGEAAGSEPETAAIMKFVETHPNIALFFDVHNAARALYYWLGSDPPPEDSALLHEMAARAEETLGYKRLPLEHAGAGLSIAWAYGAHGLPAAILELEAGKEPHDAYLEDAWGGDAFVPARPFDHPQLGPILLGNDERKLAKRNPHPDDLPWLLDRTWGWVRSELGRLPRLVLRETRITFDGEAYGVTGLIENAGKLPTDTGMAVRLGLAADVSLACEGARLAGDESVAGALAPGASRRFTVRLLDPSNDVTLVVSHPRGGTVHLPVRRPRSPTLSIRTDYEIEPGYAAPDTAQQATNEFFTDGISREERGPTFIPPVALRGGAGSRTLRVAVLLGEWHDRRHALPASAFDEALFSRGSYSGLSPTGQPVYGSVRDHYLKMSHGELDVEGEVFDWVELPGDWSDYRDSSFGSTIVGDRLLAAVEARDGADAVHGFDLIACVWAGSAVRRTSALWPMRTFYTDREGVAGFKTAELHEGEMTPIGVFCHELGHAFGVLDKYGLGATANPLGPWCLMAKGTHGGAPSGRHRPFPLCAWCRTCIGWLQPAVIDPSTPQRLALRPALSRRNECFKILLEPDGSEYLLLENRRREGALTDLPSPGLVVLRVGPGDRPQYPQTRVQLLPAHGMFPRAGGVIAHPEGVGWPQLGRTQLLIDQVWILQIHCLEDTVYLSVDSVE